MRINLEINESDTVTKKYLLIFYENDVRKSMSSFDTITDHLQEINKTKRKTKLIVFVCGCNDDVDQFDRSKGRKEKLFLSLIESMVYMNSN